MSCKYRTQGTQWHCGWHSGIDLVANTEDWSIRAIMGGTVLGAGKGSGNGLHGAAYGNHVCIQNSDGTFALYAHMRDLYVTKGQHVNAGEIIGWMGNTGTSNNQVNSTKGAHLHLEYHPNGYKYAVNCVDPAPWIGLPSGYQIREPIQSDTISNTSYGKYIDQSYVQASGGILSADQSQYEFIEDEIINQYQDDALALLLSSGYEYTGAGSISKGDLLYGRRYRIIVVQADGTAINLSRLRCVFNIEKTFFLQPNLSSVKIYNLAPQTENMIIKNGQRIIVEAGYEGTSYGTIFDGNIFQCLRYKENQTDYVLEMTALDGDRFIVAGFIKQSLIAGQTLRDEVNVISKYSTVPLDIDSVSDKFYKNKLPRAKVLFGSSAQYMNQIAKTTATAFSVQNGNGVFNDLQGEANEIIELSPESGLLGFPQQITNGINAECLLNPSITIGTAFHINNNLLRAERYDTDTTMHRRLDDNGIYKVYEMTHSGDTRGGDWKTSMNAIAQIGALPAMSYEETSNIVLQ